MIPLLKTVDQKLVGNCAVNVEGPIRPVCPKAVAVNTVVDGK